MFGVFLKETATDYQILVNVKPYRTDLRILSKENECWRRAHIQGSASQER